MTLITALQTAIARLKTEQDHVQQLIQQYDQLLNVRLGALTTQLQELQQAMQLKQAKHSRRRSEQDRLVSWQPPSVARPAPASSAEPAILVETSVADDSLKKLYRRAVLLAHPDRFAGDPDREARATEIMSQLNAAYEREDTETVQQLLTDWEDGLPFLDLPGPEPDPEALERIQQRLTQTHDALVRELATLRQSEAYRMMNADAVDLLAHFGELERRCLLQIELLRNELAL